MKKSELQQIIKEEIDKVLSEKEYTITYWYRKNDDNWDDVITVNAKSEEEAIEKAKKEAKEKNLGNKATTFNVVSVK